MVKIYALLILQMGVTFGMIFVTTVNDELRSIAFKHRDTWLPLGILVAGLTYIFMVCNNCPR